MLQFVGLISVALVVLYIVYFIFSQFFVTTDLEKYGAKQGAWALVTGSREGIGKGFAEALAQQGFNIVLTARGEAGLRTVASELQSKYNIKTKVIASDATSTNAVESVVSAVKDLDLRVLVNNVGLNTELPTVLADTDVNDIVNMINVNCTYTTLLTRELIPTLSKKPSLILCLSSFTGRVPVPMMSVYSGTKAYNEAFANALAGELAPAKIDVRAILPHYVVSAMSGLRPALTVPAAKPFALRALNQVGLGAYSIVPHWAHQLYMDIASNLPSSLSGYFGLASMKVVRKKLIKRKERHAAAAAAAADATEASK